MATASGVPSVTRVQKHIRHALCGIMGMARPCRYQRCPCRVRLPTPIGQTTVTTQWSVLAAVTGRFLNLQIHYTRAGHGLGREEENDGKGGVVGRNPHLSNDEGIFE